MLDVVSAGIMGNCQDIVKQLLRCSEKVLKYCCVLGSGRNLRVPHDTTRSRYMAHDNDNIAIQ